MPTTRSNVLETVLVERLKKVALKECIDELKNLLLIRNEEIKNLKKRIDTQEDLIT